MSEVVAVVTEEEEAAAAAYFAHTVEQDPGAWFINYGVIKDKDGRMCGPCFDLPVVANTLQERAFAYYRACQIACVACLMIFLKPRQKGASTGAEAIAYHHQRRNKGLNGALMGDIQATSDKVFEIYRRFAQFDTFRWRDGLRLNESSDKVEDLTLPGGSEYHKETAGSKNAGRSGTVQVARMTEPAWFQNTGAVDPVLAFLNSFNDASPISLGIADSTPNGPKGWFYETARSQSSAWKLIFAAWFEFEDSKRAFAHPDEREEFMANLRLDEKDELRKFGRDKATGALVITPEHLNWRSYTIENKCGGDVDKFRQEYPSDPIECLTPETRVGTSLGYVQIKDVEVGSMTDSGRVLAKELKGVRPVFTVITKAGYSFRATWEHLVSVGSEWVPVKDLLGKKVTLRPPVLAENIHIARWTGFAGATCELRIGLTWGAFLGYFMGDGSICRDSLSLVCDARDTDLIEDIRAQFTHLFSLPFGSRLLGKNKGCFEWRVASNRFKPLLETLGCMEGLRRKVCVPECIWRSPKGVVREFLRYLFEADGWASKTAPVVKFFSKHLDFTRDVQRLLLAFGVRSAIRDVVRTTAGGSFPGHELALNACDAVTFMREIGFVSARKRSGFAAIYQVTGKVRDRYTLSDEVVLVKMEEKTSPIWDLQIEGNPQFSANGILVHNCFLLSARPKFNVAVLEEWHTAAKAKFPMKRGSFTLQDDGSASFVQDEMGGTVVFEDAKFGCSYIIGGDYMTGEDQANVNGTADPDYHDIQVWRAPYIDQRGNLFLSKLVARHSSRVDTDLAAYEGVGLSRAYGDCLIVPEVNGPGLHVVKKMIELGGNVFRRNITNTTTNTVDRHLGWMTDGITRKTIIDSLTVKVRENELDIPDKEVVQQMKDFVTNAKGKPEAMAGKKDDAVMAAAIAQANIGSATRYDHKKRRMPTERQLRRDPSLLFRDGTRVVSA